MGCLKNKKGLVKALRGVGLVLLLLGVLLLIPVFWGPDTSAVESQAREAGVLLGENEIMALYQPLPGSEVNAGPDLCALIPEFQKWALFFERHKNDYSFQYAPGVHYDKEINLDAYAGQENIDLAEIYLFKYPKPQPGTSNMIVAKEDLANLAYYFENHTEQLAKLHELLTSKNRFYCDSWYKWEMQVENIFDFKLKGLAEISSAVELLSSYAHLLVSQGRKDELLSVLSDLYQLADYAGQEQFLSGLTTWMKADTRADFQLFVALSCDLDDAQLDKLMGLIHTIDSQKLTAQLCRVKEYEYEYLENMDQYAIMKDISWSLWDNELSSDYFTSLLKLTKYVDNTSKIDYLKELMNLHKGLPQNNMKEYMVFAKSCRLDYSPIFNWRSRLLMPALGHMLRTIVESEAIDRMTKIAIALEKYRLVHGDYPQALPGIKELSPELSLVDLMSQNGSDINYKRLPEKDGKKGYILTSAFFNYLPGGAMVTADRVAWSQEGLYWSHDSTLVMRMVK